MFQGKLFWFCLCDAVFEEENSEMGQEGLQKIHRLRSTAFIMAWLPELRFTPKISSRLLSTMMIHHKILG